MRTSRIRQPGLSRIPASSNSRIEAKQTGLKPADKVNSDSASRIEESSSTMITSGCPGSSPRSGGSGRGLDRIGRSTFMFILHFSVAQGIADGRKQFLGIEGLAEEPAYTLGTVLISYLVSAGDQEHRQFRAHLLHQIPKLESIHSGHPDIGNEHVNASQSADEQRSRRGEATCGVAR